MTRRGSDKTSLLDETFLPLGAELEATGRSRKGGNIQDISSLPGIIHKYWEGLDFFFFFFFVFRKDLVNFFCNSVDCNPPGSSVHKISQVQEY